MRPRRWNNAKVTRTTRVKLPADPAPTGKVKRKSKKSELEDRFADLWKKHGDGPKPVTQFMFAKDKEDRNFRFDFAWPESRVAVEIDGGTTGRLVKCHKCGETLRGRKANGQPGKPMMVPLASHGSVESIQRDCEKGNLAAELGWAVLRFTRKDLDGRPIQMIEQIERLMNFRRGDERAIRQQSFLD